ncbi:conserved hypothetical protein [Desulforapulum autotrophicum HRM2]|uniref:GIY-YIG domain-containing protein n=1 Tax=Desulforapulum autotrophicum (strain ATCC 43914 / DSM 3382 / VKM B-1955 / HRM2) TaxID=177437 RepID=C0QGS6_DESAH|nr:GIY-YIG nuclease family protein [Desulforapulum autotrophicum]ACN13551.1 conserved hypothetical protein [Desulforapulum autotrophicum HRM2]
MVWNVYLLRCNDGSLYCGVTTDVAARVATHNDGKGAKYTRSRLPVTLVAVSPDFTKQRAFQFEYRVKQLRAHEKCDVVMKGKCGGSGRRIKKNMGVVNKSVQELDK